MTKPRPIEPYEAFIKELQKNWTSFGYTKVDGEIRLATGTLSGDLMSRHQYAIGTYKDLEPTTTNQQLYYDKEARGIRAFKVDTLLWEPRRDAGLDTDDDDDIF